jgi:hypothetical protein
LSSVLQLNKSEWDAFLKEFLELAKKYELLLAKLDSGEGRLQAEDESLKQQIAKSS